MLDLLLLLKTPLRWRRRAKKTDKKLREGGALQVIVLETSVNLYQDVCDASIKEKNQADHPSPWEDVLKQDT